MENRAGLGVSIKAVRNSLDMNQTEFAKALGISRTAVFLYENERRIVPTEVVLKLYDKYGIEPNETLGIIE